MPSCSSSEFSLSRRCVCWYCHRTAAVRGRSQRLCSGSMQEQMLPSVSAKLWHLRLPKIMPLMTMLLMGDDEFVLFAGSTESLTWWTTGWWITQHLTGEQRSVHRNVQSIIRGFCLGRIRSLRCTNFIFLQPFTSHLFNKRYWGSEGDRWACLLDYIFGLGLLILWFMWIFLFLWMFWIDMLS